MCNDSKLYESMLTLNLYDVSILKRSVTSGMERRCCYSKHITLKRSVMAT